MSDSVPNIPIALWSDPVSRMVSDVLVSEEGTFPFTPLSMESHAARASLLAGEVDVALLPSSLVLSSMDEFDVLPAVAISCTSNPHASVSISDLDTRSSVRIGFEEGQEFHALIAAIILQEQYGRETSRMLVNESDQSDVTRISSLLSHPDGAFVLDLAREWYELISYPLVSALFVTRRDEAHPRRIMAVRDMVNAIELNKLAWANRSHLSTADRTFYTESIRYRLDDVSIASLTELCEFLYYYGEVSEPPQFVLAAYTDPDSEESSGNE